MLSLICIAAVGGCQTILGVEDLPAKLDAGLDADPGVQGPGVQIGFNGAMISENLSQVPILVPLNSDRVDMAQIIDDGSNLRFVAGDNQTDLPHEIEVWDPVGTSYIWVLVPELQARDSEQVIYLYYDSEAVPENPTALWADYLAVYHLSDSLTDGGDVIANSAGNDFTGTDEGTLRLADSRSGQIGEGIAFTASDTRRIKIDEAAGALTANPGERLTAEAWFLIANPQMFMQGRTFLQRDQGCQGWRLHQLGDGNLRGEFPRTNTPCLRDFAISRHPDMPISSFTDGEWHHAVVEIDRVRDVMTLYGDGQELHQTEIAPNVAADSSQLYIGNLNTGNQSFPGMIDEVRLSRKDLTPGWVRTQYASMTDQLLTFTPLDVAP